MAVLFILIPIAIMLALIGCVLYVWAVNNGQYNDLDNDAQRILFDEDKD